MNDKAWVIYDERAAGGETDEAAVLEACSSLREVKTSDWDGMDGALGYVFEYDVTADNQLTNEHPLGTVKTVRGNMSRGQLESMRRTDHYKMIREWKRTKKAATK